MATHSLRILVTGIYGLPNGENRDFASANVLQDYDAIVVSPKTVESLFNGFGIRYADVNHLVLNSELGEFLIKQSDKRRLEVEGLLEKGGIVIVLMAPVIRYTFREHQDITNYDWLMSRIVMNRQLGISDGTGSTIENLAIRHPFYEYLKLNPSWSAYSNISRVTRFDWHILASAYGTHALSLTKQIGTGHIIFIPCDYSTSNGEILESCIETILTIDEPSSIPDWAKTIVVPGQETLYPKLSELNKSIEKLQHKTKQIKTNIQELEKWKLLLYEKGKYHLEPVVRNALALFGFDDKSDTEQIADGFFSCEYGDAILEVEGSKESIKIEKISQLIRDRVNYSEDKKCTAPKGILIGNPFCEEPNENRPPKGTNKVLFTKELVETAEKQDIVVLSSTELYKTVSLILKNEISKEQKQALRKRIFESTGLIKLV